MAKFRLRKKRKKKKRKKKKTLDRLHRQNLIKPLKVPASWMIQFSEENG
jgi:hypothetical protein